MKSFLGFMFNRFKSKFTVQRVLIFYGIFITLTSYIPFIYKRSFTNNLISMALNVICFIPIIAFYLCNFMNDVSELRRIIEVSNNRKPIELLTKENKVYNRITFVGITATMIVNQLLTTYSFGNSFQFFMTLVLDAIAVWITTSLHYYYGQYIVENERIKMETLRKLSQDDDDNYDDDENLCNIF